MKTYKYKGREKEYQREYHQKYKEHYNELRRQSYQNNPEQREYHRLYRLRNPKYRQRQIELGRQLREALKLEVLTHYGEDGCACVRCGESRLACLSIDHINGNGTKHRQSIMNGIDVGGTSFYAWLKKNSFPKGYQTLCMNCQWIKRIEQNELPKGRRIITTI